MSIRFHQIRNTLSFVNYRDRTSFANNLKSIYKAGTETEGYENLQEVKSEWEEKSTYALKSWENNWSTLSTFYKYPEETRKVMYTTNIIEGLNSKKGI